MGIGVMGAMGKVPRAMARRGQPSPPIGSRRRTPMTPMAPMPPDRAGGATQTIGVFEGEL